MFRSRAETFFQQNLKQIFKMTELSEVVHVEALRVMLNLKGTNEGHYICPIFELNLTLAQGNQRNKIEASNMNAKSPQGNASVAIFEMLFHTVSHFFFCIFETIELTSKRCYGELSVNSIRLRMNFRFHTGLALLLNVSLRP